MPTFQPPVVDGEAWARTGADSDKLMRFYGAVPTGVVVWRDHTGTWQEGHYPYQGGGSDRSFNDGELVAEVPIHGLADAQVVYLGGHIYPITTAEAADLTAAGYGAYITP